MDKRLKIQLPFFMLVRTVLNTMHRMVYPFLPVLARGLGVDISSMASALIARSVVGSLGPFLAAYTDSRGRKVGMLFGVALFIIGTTLVVFFPTFPALVAAIVLAVLGKANFEPAMHAYLGEHISYRQRGMAIAVTELGWSLAFIAGIPLMGFLIARGGWMAPFPLLALLGGLSLAGVLLLIPADAPKENELADIFHNFRKVITHVPVLLGLSIGLFFTAANELVNLIFGVWLEDSFGLKIAALAAASAVIGISEFSGEGLVVLFTDRLGKPRAVAVGLAANALSALLLPVVGRSEAGALVGLFFFYLSFEFALVSLIPMMTELQPAARAAVMAFNVASHSLGRALGASLATGLYALGFVWVIAAATGFNGLALLAAWALRKTDHPKKE